MYIYFHITFITAIITITAITIIAIILSLLYRVMYDYVQSNPSLITMNRVTSYLSKFSQFYSKTDEYPNACTEILHVLGGNRQVDTCTIVNVYSLLILQY